MKKYNKEGKLYSSDDDIVEGVLVEQSLPELIEMVEQKIQNRPTAQKLLTLWRGEVNNLIKEVNEKANRKLFRPVK